MNSNFALLSLGIILLTNTAFAQTPVNAYAQVTNIAGNTLSLSNVNETFDTYEDGELVFIIQIQDDVIGGNTGNNASFGDLGSIQSAGLYEIAVISSHTEFASLPTTITLSNPLSNTYNTSPNSRLQVVSFPRLGVPNFVTTTDIGAVAWNGLVGGVVAFEVLGTLTLNHNITANSVGFRGGARSANFYDGTMNCISTPFISNSSNQAYKGEGIYTNTDANFVNARAKILNGGGGGNHINGGGGGGGNFSAGGHGGTGWNGSGTGCPVANSVGGMGGVGLSAVTTPNRLFFGGGGGGGHQNNNVASNGTNGGGLIYIKANELATSAACANRTISANGTVPSNSGNDGAGGAGAGGSIVLDIPLYTVVGTCPLQIQANGGGGGNVVSTTHAGGGGGGQGVVVFTVPQPTTNVITTTTNGLGGCNNSGCTSSADAGVGANNLGIFQNALLPIALAKFEASLQENKTVLVAWTTEQELNNEKFVLERSRDGIYFEAIYSRAGQGNSTQKNDYSGLATKKWTVS